MADFSDGSEVHEDSCTWIEGAAQAMAAERELEQSLDDWYDGYCDPPEEVYEEEELVLAAPAVSPQEQALDNLWYAIQDVLMAREVTALSVTGNLMEDANMLKINPAKAREQQAAALLELELAQGVGWIQQDELSFFEWAFCGDDILREITQIFQSRSKWDIKTVQAKFDAYCAYRGIPLFTQ